MPRESTQAVLGKFSRTRPVVIADEITRENLVGFLRRHGLEVFSLDSAMPWPETIAEVRSIKPQSVISINCERCPPADLCESTGFQWINLNMGELPKYAGAFPAQRAMMNGDTSLEIVLHYMRPHLGRAELIAKMSTPILHDDTGFTLYGRAARIGLELIGENLDHVIGSGAETMEGADCESDDWHRGISELPTIDWSRTAFDIHNSIRAFTSPGGGIGGTIHGCQLRVRKSVIAGPFCPDLPPGTILDGVERQAIDVATGSGVLRLLDYDIERDLEVVAGDCFDYEGVEEVKGAVVE